MRRPPIPINPLSILGTRSNLPAPSDATRHDDGCSPDLDPVRDSEPPLHGAPGARLHRAFPAPSGSLGLRPAVVREVQATNDYLPVGPRSTAEAFPVRQARRLRQHDSRAFPIVHGRPAPSFNPAYVRSPSLAHEPAGRRPHITLQIHNPADSKVRFTTRVFYSPSARKVC